MFKYGEEPKKVFDICVGIFLKTFLKSEKADRNEISFESPAYSAVKTLTEASSTVPPQ